MNRPVFRWNRRCAAEDEEKRVENEQLERLTTMQRD